MLPISLFVPLLGLLACETAPPEPVPPPDCATLAPQATADRCWMDQLMTLGHDQVSTVVETARLIQDPVIRGAAVFGWIDLNATKSAPADAVRVCEVLTGPNRRVCDRRQKSWHLQR